MRALDTDFESMRVKGHVRATGSAHIHINHTTAIGGLRIILTHSEFNVCSMEGMSYANRDALSAA